MLEQEDRLLTEADAVIVSSRFLDEMVGDKPRAKHLISNGCEYDYFSTPPARLDPIVAELEGPVIGYYGAISDWFNAPLVEELARRRPDWRFVLIGHTFGAQIDRLRALPNVIFTGEVAYERLTSFLDRFDVCMIPFLLTDLILATNPVKIYEYSAAGKPTVATRIPEVEQLGDLAAVADDAAGFEAAIQRCLDEPDKEARAARLRAFARQNDWDARVAVLERALRVHAYPRVSVVVLSYHNWPVTNECLQSILHETVYPNFELIVIDNGSDPSTREQLLALENLKDPRLQIRINEENLGYAGGNNQGCRMAEGDYLILLNNDTICPPEWIDKILQPFQEDPKIGLVSPMTNFAGNEQMLDVNCLSNQNQREWLKEFYRLRRGLRHEADRLGFFCVAIRREAYEQIGELDAGFEVGYFEDDDYCKRAVEAGWKLVVAEDAFVYHHGSLSFNRFDKPECEAIKQKNRARFEAKHNCQWQPPISEYMFFDEGGPGYTDRPNVIVGPCADWLSPVDRPQQMALALANEGCRVYYVTDNEEQDRFLGIRLLRPNLYLVENREECIREVCAQPISLLISFSPKADALLARVNAARVMVDLSEETAHTPWKWRRDDPRFLQAAERARWISAWSQSLTSALPAHLQEKVVPIPDGIETERFRQAPPPLPPEDLGKIIADMGGPIVACLGCVEGVCDWDWLEGLARQRRDWPFLFLDTGNKMPDRELPDFFNLRNVFLLPNRPACDLPDYLAHVDVGLIACVDAVADVACNWRSLLRFAAMGIPIVTNRRPDDPALEKTCRLAADPEAAVQAIEQCLPLRQDREFHRQCRQAIQSRDWRELLAPLTKQLMQGL
jgi:GT2 family glycosyltransferase